MVTRYRTDSTLLAVPKLTIVVDGVTSVTNLPVPSAIKRMMTDELVTKFAKRRDAGEIFNNAFSSDKITIDVIESSVATYFAGFAPQSHVMTWANGYRLCESLGYAVFPTVTLDTNTAAAKAATKAIASVNKTEVDAGNVMIEWNKTRLLHRELGNTLVKLFSEGAKVTPDRDVIRKVNVYDRYGNPLLNKKGKAVVKYSHTTVKGVNRGKSVRTKTLANLYLTFRMGILPLLSDLEGAMKALFGGNQKRATARGNETLQGQATTVQTVYAGFGKSHPLILTTTRTWTKRYGILYESSELGRLAGRLGLTRPLSTAWESLPWSFVWDWFMSVGSWLDAVQPSGASRTLCAWESTQDVTIHTISVGSSVSSASPAGTAPASTYSWSDTWSGGLTRVTTSKTRVPWVPTVPTPPVKNGLNANRCLDLAALVLQRINTNLK